ncbi:uncharacterized protein V1510DRAFT_424150 [Dipodascopsis tothii]|uniref:uncharacterized protein n=1 Tax=Dipodascopsis tothii TaxID=44089 RepID=UPI0034CF1648
MVYTLKWGIVATGWISSKFVGDLMLEAAARGVTDVRHKVVAISSSSSVERCKAFIDEICGGDPSITAYNDFGALMSDPEVDVVYIGAPNQTHYPLALQALHSGKHVLCEKPAALNAAQLRHVVELAARKQRFFMEGQWIRFFPLFAQLQKDVHEHKVIGRLERIYADLSINFPFDAKHRLFDPLQGGGAMLDLGLYPWIYIQKLCAEHPDNHGALPRVVTSMQKTKETGVDRHTAFVSQWDALGVEAVATCSLSLDSAPDSAVRIQGTEGEILIAAPCFRPTEYTIARSGEPPRVVTGELAGHGLYYEADAVARAIRDGRLVEDVCPPDESLLLLGYMDRARAEGGLAYPAELEALIAE